MKYQIILEIPILIKKVLGIAWRIDGYRYFHQCKSTLDTKNTYCVMEISVLVEVGE